MIKTEFTIVKDEISRIINKYLLNAILIAAFGFFDGIFFDVNAQTVSGSIGNGAVLRGGSAKGSIILNIPGGLHVNSSRPNSEYAIPTTVRLIGTGVQAVGISFPRGKNRRFQFSDESINVYEGRVAIL